MITVNNIVSNKKINTPTYYLDKLHTTSNISLLIIPEKSLYLTPSVDNHDHYKP